MRQRELMAITAQDENGPEDAEWITEEDVDLSGTRGVAHSFPG